MDDAQRVARQWERPIVEPGLDWTPLKSTEHVRSSSAPRRVPFRM